MSQMLTPQRFEIGFWLLLLGGLTAGIGDETDWGQRWQWPVAETTTAPAVFNKPVLAEPFHLPTPDTFLETTLRPIFVVTRRPAPIPPPPEPPRPSMKKDQFKLTGVTVVPEGKFAYLFDKAGNRTRVVGEGKEIDGIVVKEIRPDRVVLTQYDDTEVLQLRTAKGPMTQVENPAGDVKPATAAGQRPATRLRLPATGPAPGNDNVPSSLQQ
jgi:hypothetical protein